MGATQFKPSNSLKVKKEVTSKMNTKEKFFNDNLIVVIAFNDNDFNRIWEIKNKDNMPVVSFGGGCYMTESNFNKYNSMPDLTIKEVILSIKEVSLNIIKELGGLLNHHHQ